jgi:tetratricopeptide (TPR) repeat protein
MRGVRLIATIGCLLGALAGGSRAQTPPADEESPLAVGSLLHSAMNLYHTPNAPARAGRLVALSGMIRELTPHALEVQRFLADVDHSLGEYDRAAQAEKRRLEANPDDFGVQQRWLRFSIARLDRADARAAFCREVLQTESLSAPLRAQAAIALARVFAGQAADTDALAALGQALEFDPFNQSALISRLELTEEPQPPLEARTMVALLRGNPRAWWVGQELANLLGQVGLHDRALDFYAWAWEVWQGDRPLSNAPADFAEGYVSALLDAGQARRAIHLFDPAVARLDNAPEFQALMVEAFRAADDTTRAQSLLRRLDVRYKSELAALEEEPLETDGKAKNRDRKIAGAAIKLAWFYLLARDRPLKALQYARQARQLGAEGEALEMVTAAADLAAGKEQGVAVLRKLAGAHPLAAYFLARHEYDTGRVTEARQDLLAGLSHGRGDLAYRRLRDLAATHGVEVPPHPQADAVREALDDLPPATLKMGTDPGAFFQVRLEAPEAPVRLCEALDVSATLTNTSKVSLPIDGWGLLGRRLGLVVGLADRKDRVFQTVPVIVWPAPKYLQPGQSVTGSVRIDVGPIEAWLANHPLETVELSVHGVVSPVEDRQRVLSSLPGVSPPRTTLRRSGLSLAGRQEAGVGISLTPSQYRQALRQIERTLQSGPLRERMRSARQVASLLSWLRDMQQGRQKPPPVLREALSKPVLLGLMGQALADRSPLVRAEMIASLAYAELSGEMLNRVGRVVEDPSPLVRLRVVELLGASPLKANDKLIELYTRDANPNVVLMAKAFAQARRQASTPSTRPSPAEGP